MDALRVMGLIAVVVNSALIGVSGQMTRMTPDLDTTSRIFVVLALEIKMRKKKEDVLQGLVLADPVCLRKAPCEERHMGFGLFSDHTFHIGAYICEYKGEVVTADEADKRNHLGYQFYFQHEGAWLCVDAYDLSKSGLARYANDEWRKPNARVVKEVVNGTPHLFLKCVRPISPGDEIRCDYNNKDAIWRTDLEKVQKEE